MASETLIPAAEYVRMSTEEQPNSILLQQDAIRRYAATYGYEVVATYADPGKSGVEIKHRPGLQQLIHDVTGHCKKFKAILVYDVSRWGRFQDTDESAHYEFLCRRAGIAVHYCGEQFVNDGALPNAIMKSLKRMMAAEYSRQMSIKARAGMQWVASHGFYLGSRPGYGFRRMLVSRDGRRKQILKLHERKYLKTDRVILVPGPQHEVRTIRAIFALAEQRKNSPSRIAEMLNRQGIKYQDGKPWSKLAIFQILKNAKYIGCSVWGRTQRPFNGVPRKLPPSAWIRRDNAFAPLIDVKQFKRVQATIRSRNYHIVRSNEYFLNAMKRILAKDGKLTLRSMQKRLGFHHGVYLKRFGSIIRAYELVGYKPSTRTLKARERTRIMFRLRDELLDELRNLFPASRIAKRTGSNQRPVLEFDKNLQLSIHICRPLLPSKHGHPSWVVRAQPKEQKMAALLCFPDLNLTEFKSFYLIPEFGNMFPKRKHLREGHPWLAEGKRLTSLEQLYEAACNMLNQPPLAKEEAVGDVVFEQRTWAVRIGRERIAFSRGQAALFKLLFDNAGRVVTSKELCRTFHEKYDSVRARVEVLRKKLGPKYRKRIVTVKDVGMMYKGRNGTRKHIPMEVHSIPISGRF